MHGHVIRMARRQAHAHAAGYTYTHTPAAASSNCNTAMSSTGEGYGRHRMDRSLDEIAAEMNSHDGSSAVPFGQDYEERDYIGAPIRGVSSGNNRRHAPYSASSRVSYRDRGQDRDRSPGRDDVNSSRVFVANLSYNTTWQSLKDHMRKGCAMSNKQISDLSFLVSAAPIVKCDVFRDSGGSSRVSTILNTRLDWTGLGELSLG